MSWITGPIKWIMLVGGLLTCTMFRAAIAPQSTMISMFGVTLEGPAGDLVVRSWGVLIGLIGLLLVYGAFRPAFRAPIVVVAGASKAIFVGLVLTQGLFAGGAAIAVVIDAALTVVFVLYLLAMNRQPVMSRK